MSDNKPQVLVVDDEIQMRRFMRLALAGQGYRVLEASTGREGQQLAAAYTPDVILLDLGLPDMDGIEVTRGIREWTATPILIISARGQEAQKVEALDAGADDYLTKPFGSEELMARIRAALRRATRPAQDSAGAVVTIGDVRMDFAKRLVFVRGAEIHLTPIEYKLLAALVQNAGKVMTHKQLLDRVWGPGHAQQMQYLRVFMAQLRQKIETNPAHPRHLLTEPAVGYRFKSDG